LRWENTSALTTAETDIDALEGRMTTAETDIDALEGRMTTAEGDIDDIEDGTTIVPKALADQNGNVINTTYLTQISATATYIPLSQKGQANGVVPLGSNGKVPSIYLSGEQDDIQEFDTLEDFPLVGEADILYVAIDTNKLYRWGGSAYVVISETLALGTTNTTAFPGDRGLALETLTDNIVDGDQALALKDQVIRNTVVGTSPLVVNSIASTTANLTEFQVNGTKVLEITPVGGLAQNGARLLHQTGSDVSIYLGKNSGNLTTNALANTSIGASTANSLTSGGFNVFVGHNAGSLNTTGASNVYVGQSSGAFLTTGTGNTFLGQDSGANVSQLATATNSTGIGRQAFTDKSNQMVFGNASVSEFKFDRNASATLLVPQITSSFSGGNSTFNRGTTALTNESASALEIKHTTSADMVDGFGARQLFTIRDSANIDYTISRLGAVRSGADNSGRFVFETNNAGTLTEKMTILPNGNVGIGTASPSAKLDVSGGTGDNGISINSTTSGNPFIDFKTDGTARANIYFDRGNNLFRINSSTINTTINHNGGNVGIGTSSPARILEITSATNTQSYLRISGASGNAADTNFAGIEFFNNDGSQAGPNVASFIEARAIDSTGAGSHLVFGTQVAEASEGARATEKMRILGNGNVGIGTTTPVAILHLGSPTTATYNRVLRVGSGSATDGNGNYIEFPSTTGDNGSRIGGTRTASGGASDLRFETVDGGTSLATERLRIRDTGLVGINETAPTAQLQVKSGATTRVPLIVDTIASHTAVLQEWKDNGTTVSFVNRFGSFATSGSIFNLTSVNNALIQPTTSGTIINRNVADTNPALIVNLANASATGNIQVWQKAGTAQSFTDNRGQFYKTETRTTLTEPTFTNPSTGLFVYTITSTQLNDNDEIYITKTATADNQTYKVVVPNTSKNVRIWVRILPGGFTGITNLLETAKSTSEFVKLVFEESASFGASNFYDGTESYLATNIDHALLFENINGKQKCITEVFINEI
jgi:hypothetical protein